MGCASSCQRSAVQATDAAKTDMRESADGSGLLAASPLPSLFPDSQKLSGQGSQELSASELNVAPPLRQASTAQSSDLDFTPGPGLSPLTTGGRSSDTPMEPKTPAFGLLGAAPQPPPVGMSIPGHAEEPAEDQAKPAGLHTQPRTDPNKKTVAFVTRKKSSKFFERLPAQSAGQRVSVSSSNPSPLSTPPRASVSNDGEDAGGDGAHLGQLGGCLSEFGSLTGWQAIAAGIMNGEGLDDDDDEDQTSQQSYTNMEANDLIPASLRLASINPQAGESFYSDYEILEELGQGAYGKAYRAVRRLDGEMVVAKMIDTSAMSKREKLETKQEIKVLAHMDHPSIVKYLAAYAEDEEIIIVMEYCAEGDLTKFLKKRKTKLLEEHQIMLRFVQVCLALHHVHEKGILHRDLKSSNIFCDTHSILKLGDFGISKMMGAETNTRTIVGTPYYLSPEICEDKPYGVKSDIWSLGCVLYELCTLRHAFDGKSLPQLVLKILNGKFPPIADHYSDSLKELVNSLLARDPKDRPELNDIFKSEYVQNHLTRYVVHIKKHVMKRKESFKRSVATWDENDVSDLPDSPDTNSLPAKPGHCWRSDTIEKRRNSLSDDEEMPVDDEEDMKKLTIPRGSTARQLKIDYASGDLDVKTPPRRQRTAAPDLYGKVSFKIPAQERRSQTSRGKVENAKDRNDGSDQSGDDEEDDADYDEDPGTFGPITDLDLSQALGAQGLALLRAGLPGTRFGDSEPETPGGPNTPAPTPMARMPTEAGQEEDNADEPVKPARRTTVRFSDCDGEGPSLVAKHETPAADAVENPTPAPVAGGGLLGQLQLPASNWAG